MVLNGLGTQQQSVGAAGTYDCIISLNLPTISKGDPASSQVVTVIKQNGSTIYTGLAGAEGTMITVVCAAGDIIAVQLSSAAAVDQGLNAVRGIVAIG